MMQLLGRDVVIKDNSMSAQRCDEFISMFQHNAQYHVRQSLKDTTYAGDSSFYDLTLRIKDNYEMQKYLRDLLRDSVREYKESLNIDQMLGTTFEHFEIMCFKKGENQFDPHIDANSTEHFRSLALIWYLNDVEEGGLLKLPSKSKPLSIKPQKGRLLIMPSDWTHYHLVTTPESGDRYSLITFLRFTKDA